jgi:hypothetical protein
MITAVLAVVVVVALAWEFFSGPSSSDCAPVRELLTFNKTQIESMNAKTRVPEAGSYDQATAPSDLDYRNWVDGLNDRAAKVTESDLAAQSKDIAETADRLVRARIDLNVQSEATAPGAPAPPAAMAVRAFNEEFEARVGRLTEACS